MTQHTLRQSSGTTAQPSTLQLPKVSPDDLIMYPCIAMLILFAVLWLSNSNPRKNVGRARMATRSEVLKARAQTVTELDTQRGLTLWVGLPKTYAKMGDKTIFVPDRDTVLIPQASEHIGVCGTTGAGKTRFFLNRLAFSAVQQGLPIIALDMKGDEEVGIATPSQRDALGWQGDEGKKKDGIAPTSEIAGFALENDYEVFPVAPFFPDSLCLNPIHLIRGPDHLAIPAAARVSGGLINNCAGPDDKKDFWSKAGQRIVMLTLLMVSELEHGADLATCHQILCRLNECPQSIHAMKISPYRKAVYAQFLALCKTSEAAASAISVAMDVLSRFVVPQLTAVFCRGTTVPIVLKPRQMVVFRVDPRYADIVTPLVAACLEAMIDRNVYAGTGFGGLLWLDELPQVKLLSLAKLIGVARSKLWSVAYGYQGKSILELAYGKNATEAIFENTGTRWVGKQAKNEGNKALAESFGKEDIKAKSRNTGKGGGGTVSDQQRDLVTVHELEQMPSGRAIVISPGVFREVTEPGAKKEKRVSVPFRHQFKIPRREIKAMESSKKTWLQFRGEQIARKKSSPLTNEQLEARAKLALSLLPEPEKIPAQTEVPATEQSPSTEPNLDLESLWRNVNAITAEFS